MTIQFGDIQASEPYVRETFAYALYFKRAVDILIVLAAAPIVILLAAVVSLFIVMDGHSPLYSQSRIGRGGRVFKIWKLRSMMPNAEAYLKEHLAQDAKARAEWQTTQKLKSDPRITKIGRLIRQTSLDELPQLWNVLMGDMSLVGPRPMMVEQSKYYSGTAYYRLRPGVTGLWQVSDRNNCAFSVRAAYDDEYARNVSLSMDSHILFRTVGVVFNATGH